MIRPPQSSTRTYSFFPFTTLFRSVATRSVDHAFLFKLNAFNGRITRVASSPLDAGSFLVDHQGNVRYPFGVMNDGSNAVYRRDGESWSLEEKSAPFVGLSFLQVGF